MSKICSFRRYLKIPTIRTVATPIDTSGNTGLARDIELFSYHEQVDSWNPRGLVMLDVDWENNQVRFGWSLTASCDHFSKHKAVQIASSRASSFGWFDINEVLENPEAVAIAYDIPEQLNHLYDKYITWLRYRHANGPTQKAPV